MSELMAEPRPSVAAAAKPQITREATKLPKLVAFAPQTMVAKNSIAAKRKAGRFPK